MSGFSSLYIGVSGLQSSQIAINTTSHNIVNANNKGYVRQQVALRDSIYNKIGYSGSATKQVGLGVDIQEIRHLRDSLLDKAFRMEHGRQSFYEYQSAAVVEAQEILGELDGVPFSEYLTELRESVYEMEKDPSSVVARSSFIQNAVSFLSRADAVYGGLQTYQATLNQQVVNMVNNINQIGHRILELNKAISAVEAGPESANDMRDERDNLLDELSSLIKIDYSEDEKGIVRVRAEGILFVDSSIVNEMGVKMLDTDVDSDYYSPVWKEMDDRQVFNLQVPVSTEKGTDVGALKGILLARGNSVARYTDIPDKADPKYQLKDAQGNFIHSYDEDLDEYRRLVEPSAIKTIMGEFDQLVNEVVEQINDVLCPNISAIEDAGLAAGTVLKAADGTEIIVDSETLILDTENAGYSAGDNKVQGVELFRRKNTDRYIDCTDDNGNVYRVYNTKNDFGLESLYTLGNIEMNEPVLDSCDLLGFTTANGEVDQKRANALADAWNTPYIKLGPDYVAYNDFAEYYSEFVGQIGNAGMLFDNMVSYQDTLTLGVDGERMALTGVSTEEELAYLIQFQNAYNAASRYITVIDEMLEHIVTAL